MSNHKLYDINSTELFEFMENMKLNLKKQNIEYKNLFNQIENIKNQYPNVRGILEDEEIGELTLEESKALMEAINLYRDLLKIEEYETFLLGSKQCFEYLKKIKVL